MKKSLLVLWAIVTVLLAGSVFTFEIIPRYQSYDAIAASAEAIGMLRCVGRRPNCLSPEWSDRMQIQTRCPGMPCLGLGERYEYKLIEFSGESFAVARLKIQSDSMAGSTDSWFFGLDGDSTDPAQCRDRTATAGVFRRETYQPNHPICAHL